MCCFVHSSIQGWSRNAAHLPSSEPNERERKSGHGLAQLAADDLDHFDLERSARNGLAQLAADDLDHFDLERSARNGLAQLADDDHDHHVKRKGGPSWDGATSRTDS